MRKLLPLLLLPLAACAAAPSATEPAPAPPAEAEACGAAALQRLVGQPRSVLAAMTFHESTRFIGPDTAITMDYSPNRLNIEYDRSGTITRVFCG